MSNKKLTRLFNSLSLWDRVSLRGAAMMRTMARSIRDDVVARPERLALFVFPLAMMIVPMPLPGHHVISPFLMLAWSKMRLTDWARKTDDQLKEAFREHAMVRDHAEFIKMNPDGTHDVDNAALGIHTVKEAVDDGKHAVTAAVRRVRDIFLSPPNP